MSGPKLVQILSEKELRLLERHRDQLLERLNQTIADWVIKMQEVGAYSTQRHREIQSRASAFKQQFFPYFDKTSQIVRDEMRALDEEVQQALAERKAKARQHRRQVKQSAQALTKQLAVSGKQIPSELCNVINAAENCDDTQLETLQKVVNKAMSGLIDLKTESGAITKEPSALANALSEGLPAPQPITKFFDNLVIPQEQKNARIDLLLSQLEVLEDPSSVHEFSVRLESISNASQANQDLLLDSLAIDLSAQVRRSREANRARQILQEVEDELKNLSPAQSKEFLSQLNSIPQTDAAAAAKFAEGIRANLRDSISRESSDDKRNAVLNGLRSLGYRIHEGMATVWAKDGRLVVTKAHTPGIGVELGSADTTARIQMRAVRLTKNGKILDDTDGKQVEKTWCSDLDQLRKGLSERGHTTYLETATPAGAIPLKVCEQTSWIHEDLQEQDFDLKRQHKRRQ